MCLANSQFKLLESTEFRGFDFGVTASALDSTGKCGENVNWRLTLEGDLVISGAGSMYQYGSSSPFAGSNKIRRVIVEDGVTGLAASAFDNCTNLEYVSISSSVKSIGDVGYETSFYGCKNLKIIEVDKNNPIYSCDSNGVLFDKSKTILLKYPEGNTDKTYTIPKTVTKILVSAFAYNNYLEEVVIPDSVTMVDTQAFYWCKNLCRINLPESITSIGSYAFNSIGITSIDIPSSIDKLNSEVFANCINLTSVSLPDTITTIGSGAFIGCINLNHISIPFGVTEIGSGAFGRCTSLSDLILPNGLKKLSDGIFEGCINLTDIDIPNSVTSIGFGAFRNCSNLVNVNIPNSVKTIDECAFYNCDNLTSIDIPKDVTIISENSFADCDNLTSIDIPNGVTTISENAFSKCYNLTRVCLPSSTTNIEKDAFSYCYNLTDITIPDNITSIKNETFLFCYELKSVTVSDKVKSIENYAFGFCDNLNDVYYNGTEKQWQNIAIGIGNEALLNANIHFLGEYEPHICLFGDWFTETEPTIFNEGVSKRVCQCGKSETKAIAKLETGTTKDQTTNIEIIYREENFDNEFTVVASEEFLDKDIIFGDAYQNFKVYDISLEINNQKIQPKGYITVKIPLPEYFTPETTAVYYIGDNNMVKLESKIENGFVIFETDHFSLYAIVDEFENENQSENCSHNCHKGGISGFFWKIINFFNKIFKLKQFCDCGAKHW